MHVCTCVVENPVDYTSYTQYKVLLKMRLESDGEDWLQLVQWFLLQEVIGSFWVE